MNQFEILSEDLEGVKLVRRFSHDDLRGYFTKTFNHDMFLEVGLDFTVRESLTSKSERSVLRGMHFQSGESACSKFVSVADGEILDVVVKVEDCGCASPTGSFYSAVLSKENSLSLLVPRGYAHGFLVLSESATVVYHQDQVYNAEADTGIRFDSFGFDWPIKTPTLSEKDQTLPKFRP